MSRTPPAADHSARDAQLHRDGVVHDVNQMLAVILGRAEFLRERTAAPEVASDLAAIIQAARDATAILRRLGGPLPAAACGLRDCVTASLSVIRPQDGTPWEAPGRWRAANGIPTELGVSLPASEVREVLNNLLLNALAVMPDGGEVTFMADDLGDRIRLTVSDTGPGLPKEVRERIFTAGYSTSAEPGRGVGLAACRQLLAARGGKLELAPETEGTGATFVLDLPPGSSPTTESVPVREAPALTVLVVDDESAVAGMLADVLGAWGCRVDQAGDADAAQEIFTPGCYQLVLVDWNLPGRSGLELAADLRGTDPATTIILTTGLDRAEGLSDKVGPDVDGTLVKPLDLEDLRRVLGKAADLTAARQGTETDKEAT